MISKAKLFPALALLFTLCFTGCSRSEREISIYSDIPEAVVLVNLFNQTQDEYTARFIYAEGKSSDDADPGLNDVVISSQLHSSAYKEKLRSLEAYREDAFIKDAYPELLKTGIEGTMLKSVPLSLDIAVAIGSEAAGAGKFVSWDEMQIAAVEFNKSKEEQLTACGFSPLWSDSFLSAWFHSGIRSYDDLFAKDDFSLFDIKSRELIDWIDSGNGGLERDEAFSAKYRYIPDYRLIMEGRTGFTVMALSDWALLPDAISRELTGTPLIIGGGLQNLSLISAGLPAASENPEGGEAFMSWLLLKSTWEDYLKLSTRNRDSVFAFLGGISASEELNFRILPDYYPRLKNSLPRKGEFARQTDIPSLWTDCWEGLFLPLIRESISGGDVDFADEYRKWLLLNPDPWES